MRKEQRNNEIMQLISQGISYAEIGERYNLTIPRVRELHACGMREKAREKTELWRFLANCPSDNKTRIYNILLHNGISTVDELKQRAHELPYFRKMGARGVQIVYSLLNEQQEC